jgi:hypothetical protein
MATIIVCDRCKRQQEPPLQVESSNYLYNKPNLRMFQFCGVEIKRDLCGPCAEAVANEVVRLRSEFYNFIDNHGAAGRLVSEAVS